MSQEAKSVELGEYIIVSTTAGVRLHTIGLGPDIAFTVYAPQFGKAALARNLMAETVQALFQELSNDELESASEASILIRLVGVILLRKPNAV